MQAHLWQLQLVQQQQRQQQQRRRRRHSVCMGSMQHRCWTRPYGVMGEMMPFQETDEWPQQSLSAPSSGCAQRSSDQQHGLVGRDVMLGHIVPPSPIAEDPADTAGGLSSGSLCGLQGSTARSTSIGATTLPSAAFSSALGSPSDPGTTLGAVSSSHAALSGQFGLSPLPGGSSLFGDARADDEDDDDVQHASDVASASSEQQLLLRQQLQLSARSDRAPSEQQQLQQGLGYEVPVRGKAAQGRSAAASLRSSSE
jgi:hypothetical protein